MPQEYHLIAWIEGNGLRLSPLLNKANPPHVPTTSLNFQPLKSDPAVFPVTIFWKTTAPNNPEMVIAAEQAILNYCARLYNEAAYSGPIDCCL